MITSQSIGDILRSVSTGLGIDEVYVVMPGDDANSDELSKGEIKAERVVVYPKEQVLDTYWIKSYNEINIVVPRIQNRPNRIRLEELESKAISLFDGITGHSNGISYYYSIDSIGTKTDPAMNCEYVFVTILFEVLNVKKK